MINGTHEPRRRQEQPAVKAPAPLGSRIGVPGLPICEAACHYCCGPETD